MALGCNRGRRSEVKVSSGSVIHLFSRDRRAAKREVLGFAKEAFARWDVRGEYKDPGAVWKSLRRRLQASSAFDALVSDKHMIKSRSPCRRNPSG